MTTPRRTKRPTRSRPDIRPLAIRWTERATADLEAIGDYIAQDKPVAAARWVEGLIAMAERAALLPLAGRRVPELARDDIREVRKRTYRIVYRVAPGRIDVLTVFEGHRQFPRDAAEDESEE
jgi:toxin ParE1/3/4